MRESALGRLRLEWRVWYVTMPRARARRRRSKRWARAGERAERVGRARHEARGQRERVV